LAIEYFQLPHDISPIERFLTFLSMNLAYALRGELITLLNKRLMTTIN